MGKPKVLEDILDIKTSLSDISINVKDFGAKGDGITDDTSAIQACIDSLDHNKGGIVLIPAGYKFKITEVKILFYNITFTGGGTLYGGKLTIGDPTTNREMNFIIDGVIFEYASIVANQNSIEVQNAKRGRIYNCRFINADKGIYFKPIDTFQHSNRILISNNIFEAANYCLYVDKPSGATNTYVVGDIHFENNQAYGGINYGHIYGLGVDGLVCTGNTLFFPSYTGASTTKAHNIYLDYCNWVVIQGNNLFEAGLNAIYLAHFQNCNVHGNNIAWPGQRIVSSAIKLSGGDTAGQQYNLSSISGNNIQSPSLNGIEIIDNCGMIDISGNQIAHAGDTAYLYGSTSAAGKYGIYTETTTQYINISGNNNYMNSNKIQGTNSMEVGNLKGNGSTGFIHSTTTISDTSTSVNVQGIDIINLSQSSATTITGLTGAYGGQVITLCAFNANTTLASSLGNLKGGVNASIPNGGTITLRYLTNKWYEIGRSF